MGMSFRKSVNVGGLRFNLSKSGIGTSIGVKGLRVGMNSKGSLYGSVGIPKTGLTNRFALTSPANTNSYVRTGNNRQDLLNSLIKADLWGFQYDVSKYGQDPSKGCLKIIVWIIAILLIPMGIGDDPKMRALAEGDWKHLYDFILGKLKPSEKNYIFLDEIQNIASFERLLEGLFVHPDIDLYVTGSNAYLLSSELATLLTGRAFEINVLPFSFAEYLQYQGNENNLPQHFAKYLRLGGFPEAVNLATTNEVLSAQYLQQVYRSILENDISQRHKIYSEQSYQNVVNFLIDSVGSQISPTNIANVLTSSGKKIDKKSVARYIDTLVESYLLYEAKRYDIKGKALLKTQEKYYLVDTGLRNALMGRELGSNAGHLLENVVYLELLRRDNAIWIGKIDSQEVDFIVRDKNGYTQYIQVAQTVASDETLKRELAPFAKIRDHYEKILLTTDWQDGSHSGIKQINVFEWLLDK